MSPFKSMSKPLSLLLLITILGCGKQQSKNLARDFESLRRDVLAGKYEQTIPRLQNFLKNNPDSKQASRAGLFLFKCYFAENDLENAKRWCNWTIEKHPRSLEAAKCKFKLVLIQMVSGKIDAAKTSFESLAVWVCFPVTSTSR